MNDRGQFRLVTGFIGFVSTVCDYILCLAIKKRLVVSVTVYTILLVTASNGEMSSPSRFLYYPHISFTATLNELFFHCPLEKTL
jgi:hypothetical protein